MKIIVDEDGAFPVVCVEGELGAIDAESLADALAGRPGVGCKLLAIEMSKLAGIDSSNLSVLINTTTRARLGGNNVVLVAPSRFVREVLNITRLNTWFDIADSLEEAATKYLCS